jgi:hypothetical protein
MKRTSEAKKIKCMGGENITENVLDVSVAFLADCGSFF